MAIQWFPGHMHLTKKAIGDRIKNIDVVIELLDARLPGSSANPMLAELTAGKPALKVLNKHKKGRPRVVIIENLPEAIPAIIQLYRRWNWKRREAGFPA